jgi:hypothetical protein
MSEGGSAAVVPFETDEDGLDIRDDNPAAI